MAYKVLIVDDEEIVCRGLAQFVKWKEHGFEVAGTACNVDEALILLNQLPFQAVFTDIRMPEKTGLELLEILQKEYPGIKSVVLSGFSEFSYAREALRYGAVDYLSKPVNLKEVEQLLDKMRERFEEEEATEKIRSNRTEAILLSIAKGYGRAETENCNLPSLCRWYGISFGLLNRDIPEEKIQERKEQIRREIEGVVPEAFFLNHEVYGMFAIIPYELESEMESFTWILQQLEEVQGEWACGISKAKRGMKDLRVGFLEAERALRYQKAGEKSGLAWYGNVEKLFSQSSARLQEGIAEIKQKLTDPKVRRQVPGHMDETLEQLGQGMDTVMQFQTACIQCLIELYDFLQAKKLQNVDLHRQLNGILEKLLLCNDIQSSRECMKTHLEFVVEQLDSLDEGQFGKGVIKEIQLYILKHYDENITLSMLSEQFYLHPNYLSRLFKEKTGKNYVDYVTEVRMEKVKELLGHTEDKVADISVQVGYENPRYFSKAFKQFTGLSPSEYREKERGKDLRFD